MAYTRKKITCDVCQGRKQLWLRGSDYVECPQCEATGQIEVMIERVQAKVQERYVPSFAGGYKKHSVILVPHSGWRDQHGAV